MSTPKTYLHFCYAIMVFESYVILNTTKTLKKMATSHLLERSACFNLLVYTLITDWEYIPFHPTFFIIISQTINFVNPKF